MKHKKIVIALIAVVLACIIIAVIKMCSSTDSITLTVNCDRDDAEIAIRTIDGTAVKPADESGRVYRLAPGEYTYSAKCENCVTIESYYFKVGNQNEQTLTIEMIPMEDAYFEARTPVIENQDMYQDYINAINGISLEKTDE